MKFSDYINVIINKTRIKLTVGRGKETKLRASAINVNLFANYTLLPWTIARALILIR